MVKLSICIPYYKTYDLTVKLLERLIPQLTNETEAILCDDGCNETRLDVYKDRIKIIHIEKNQGGAINTNECINRATGKYVALIDSDDFISEDYVETLLNAINEHDEDLIYMGWKNMETGNIVLHPRNYAPWKCIYKREKMPRFDEDWTYAFDVPFHERVESLNLSKYYIEKLLYYYNAGRKDNLTHKKQKYLKNQMKYIIMCGGNYNGWEQPRQLTKICGEEIVARTIRLLKENNIENIAISSNNPIFEKFNVPILKHNNSFDINNIDGDWFDAFYPTDEPTCYIFGDVVFSPEAIKTIVEKNVDDIELFGSTPPYSRDYIKNHIEPFALKVMNTKHLKEAIQKTKKLDKQGKFWRKPIMWELWTVIKNVPLQTKPDEYIYNYTAINDYTVDIDRKSDIMLLNIKLGGIELIKVEAIKPFTLGKFNEITNIVRKGVDTPGMLYVGDTFECTKEMAEYLTGKNDKGNVVVKVIEIIPEKEKPIGESIQPIERVVEEIGKNQLEKTIAEKPKVVQNKATKKKHSKK